MSGSPAKVLGLWRELVGDPEYERGDLDGIWPVNLGSVTEQLNLDWFERKRKTKVGRRGEVVVHKTIPWVACTLDGLCETTQCPIEAKHVGGFEPFATIIDRYYPQCQWQIEVLNAPLCYLSVIEGAKAPRIHELERDDEYIKIMLDRAERFMQCVWSLTPPV